MTQAQQRTALLDAFRDLETAERLEAWAAAQHLPEAAQRVAQDARAQAHHRTVAKLVGMAAARDVGAKKRD